MLKKGSKLYPVLHLTCPRCHQGKLFKGGFSYRFSVITAMHEHCPECGLKFEREPGFFYGAMYVSYALTVALWVAIAVAFYVLFGKINPWLFMTFGVLALFALLPGIYRLSRAIWLVMFVPYEADHDKTKKEEKV
jgi:uncharacterized protein (DUF983 family)